MKKIVLSIIAITAFLLIAFTTRDLYSHRATDPLIEGEIVFQMSTSRQSPMIAAATASPWTHCGIIIRKPDGLYVLEASKTVKLTKWEEWKNRGRGKYAARKRYYNDDVRIDYEKFLGQPYDLEFKFDNGKMYCSELVYIIYKEQFGVELCKPRHVSDYHLYGLDDVMKSRNIDSGQLVVAPSDLYESDKLW